MTTNNTSYPTKIYPEFRWMDEEILGDGKWTCVCGQPHFFETIDIYDELECELCTRKYKLHISAYLSSPTTKTGDE